MVFLDRDRVQESVLDYAFATLNIQDERVDHPIVMTECPCNPNYSRGRMSSTIAVNITTVVTVGISVTVSSPV